MRVQLWFGLRVEALALWFILSALALALWNVCLGRREIGLSLNIFFSSRDKKDILHSLEPKHLLDPQSSRIEHFRSPPPPQFISKARTSIARACFG